MKPRDSQEASELGTMDIVGRVLAVAGAFILSFLLYRVGKGAYAQYNRNSNAPTRSLLWKWKARAQHEPDYQPLEGTGDAEDEDEGYHDGESASAVPFSPYLDSKPLPSKPLPDKPLPPLPRT